MSETEVVPPMAIKPVLTPLDVVVEALKDVVYPELGVNVVDLGLVYGLRYGQNDALLITMTLTSAACLLAEMIEEQVGKALNGIVGEWRLTWVWLPPWGPDRITDDGRNQMRALGFQP
jgi:metal-sulfur cluster biosynthetic enzyme